MFLFASPEFFNFSFLSLCCWVTKNRFVNNNEEKAEHNFTTTTTRVCPNLQETLDQKEKEKDQVLFSQNDIVSKNNRVQLPRIDCDDG